MTANDDLHQELKQLKNDFSQLRGDVGDLLQVLRDAGLERMANTKTDVNDELRTRREQVRSALNKARAQGEEVYEDFEEGVATHPLSSLAMAFGLGFIIAKLVDGGRH
jgi:ElaB/YqjD/DUF883 family membrane-anchored ribosome-binding protein